MGWAQTFIAVDWGTTNRRAWRIAGGVVAQEFEDSRGVLSVDKAAFPAAVAEIRERLGDHPLLMAGMVGSNRGWVEAPYVPCPAGLADIAGALCWAATDRAPAIVAALATDTDTPPIVTAVGRCAANSATASRATTVRPSNTRSTATDEIAAVRRVLVSRAAV